MKYTKKELLAVPKRTWHHILLDVVGVYVIPTKTKHDSGYACMEFVAEFKDKEKPLVRFGGGCDDVSFEGEHFRMDCLYPSKIIRIWNRNGFSVSADLSSINFTENKWGDEK